MAVERVAEAFLLSPGLHGQCLINLIQHRAELKYDIRGKKLFFSLKWSLCKKKKKKINSHGNLFRLEYWKENKFKLSEKVGLIGREKVFERSLVHVMQGSSLLFWGFIIFVLMFLQFGAASALCWANTQLHRFT